MFDRISDLYCNKLVVVVGAGGIGGEIVRLLAGVAGAMVVADHSRESLDRVVRETHPHEIAARELDVRDSRSVNELFSFVKASYGVPDFLFYTAGVLNIESFLQTTVETWDRAVDINLNGAFLCTKAASDLMVSERRGSILILGSIAGTKARSGSRVNPVYNATKAAIAAFVNATAMQLRPFGIRINCISPGPTETRMMDVQPAQVHDAVKAITLDGRMNRPSEVAELALFVAGHGRFTGEDIGMGGGAGLGG